MECAEQRSETLFDLIGCVACELKCFYHNVGTMVSDRARGQLNTVADYIVLISLYCQRILIFESVHTALRH